ncbi:MAG: hypothetical protein Q4B43_05870 [Bacteroidota bacterium]|nr:hypothetical protein [Bacteroidota bacterium]
MSVFYDIKRTRAQESSAAIERLYVTMRHLFNRGFYKPMGISGDALREDLLLLSPEIYGSMKTNKVELKGLLYVIERLPIGIEQCRFINLISDEGYSKSHFIPIVPTKRKRNCYRIDEEQINIEITRGRSDIYDILTHLTFMFIESHKIKDFILLDPTEGVISKDWKRIEQVVSGKELLTEEGREQIIANLSNILGRTFIEILEVYHLFGSHDKPDRFVEIIYWLGKLAIEEVVDNNKRVITFSPILRERLGHHIYGEKWANNIKQILFENKLIERPIHIVSANMHSVMNTLFAQKALTDDLPKVDLELYEMLSDSQNKHLRKKVIDTALENGMFTVLDTSGTNIDVQIFDVSKVDLSDFGIQKADNQKNPVLIVMDYAFGEQAYETIDELLKPFQKGNERIFLDVQSISIMGKAGILEGKKGDIMIPSSHINEGTGDNYPFENQLSVKDFENQGVEVYSGSMITVLGTSLQNKDLLDFFHKSTWAAIGLEMEGAYYQKAIQSASRIRKSIPSEVKVRYAYYASDNPLETGSTLASGSLGKLGVKPTYLITKKILEQIFHQSRNESSSF